MLNQLPDWRAVSAEKDDGRMQKQGLRLAAAGGEGESRKDLDSNKSAERLHIALVAISGRGQQYSGSYTQAGHDRGAAAG